MPEIKKQHNMHPTDYAAIIFAVLLAPLLIMRSFSPELIQMASDMRIFSDNYYPSVKTPIMTTMLEQNILDKTYVIPHVLFPAYKSAEDNSSIDAVAFTGLQKEMLYSQRFSGMRYRSPYVAHRAIFTEKTKAVTSEEESKWKNTAFYFNQPTGCSGRIKSLHQNPTSLNVAGITDSFEIFLRNKRLDEVFVSKDLAEEIADIIIDNDVISFFSTKITSMDDGVYVAVTGETQEKNVIIVFHRLDLTGKKIFTRILKVDKDSWDIDESEPIINPLFTSASEKQTDVPLKVLREALAAMPTSVKHGLHSYMYPAGDSVVFKSKQFIAVLDKQTGLEICSFAIKFGAQLFTDGDSIIVEYLSDQQMLDDTSDLKRNKRFDIVSQKLDGDTIQQAEVSLLFVTPVSEQGAAIESQMQVNVSKLGPTSMTLVAPVRYQNKAKQEVLVFLAPNGVLVAVDSTKGTKIWQQPVKDFAPSTLNAHISIQDTEEIQIIILTIGFDIYIYNAQNGQLLGKWQIDEKVKLQDSIQNFYDDDMARVQTQVLVERLHPYVDKKAIFVVRGKFLDVVGISNVGVALTNFWERTMLVGLVAFVLAIVFRLVITVINKKD